MEIRSWRSTVLVAVLLSPALLQSGDCGYTPNANLASLEIETGGLDRVVGFNPAQVDYGIWTPGSVTRPVTMLLRARAASTIAAVHYELTGAANASGTLFLGGGEVTLDRPNGPSTLVLIVNDKGTLRTYTIEMNPPCAGGDCDDASSCTTDTCDTITSTCSFEVVSDGAACDFKGEPGACSGEICVPFECTFSEDCPIDHYCEVFPALSCVDGQGSCMPLSACPLIVLDTCGCDGVTYTSFCDLNYAGVRPSGLGACDCDVNADCDPTEYCNAVTCDGPGHCDPRPASCDSGPGDVAACDGQTYDSVCEAAAAGTRVGGELYPPFL
ncbi:MAG: hypothetical protein ACN4G0_19480 [Polyangiales bacterium]